MRAHWEALHAGLVRSVRSLKHGLLFDRLRERHEALGRFADATSLLAHLTSRDGDLDEKDLIYASLVESAQARSATGELAIAILMLGLWPGLDAIYRRCFHLFDGEEAAAELTSEISAQLAAVVDRANLTQIRRVAATLVLNTKREIIDARHRLWKGDALYDELPEDDQLVDAGASAQCGPSDLGIVPGHSADEEREAMRRWLEDLVGRDAALVIAVVIDGENQREAGERLDLNHETARKRFQTAMRLVGKRVRPRREKK